MTKQEAIDTHTHRILQHNMLLKSTTFETAEADDKKLKELEREISILGQAYNPRISRKAQVALGW